MRKLMILPALVVAGCSWLPWPPNPQPTPTPEPPPAWECQLEMPECGEVNQTCSTPESPCWHNPTSNPEHCEEAPACPPPPPACPEECPEGQHCVDPEVGCVPKPVDPPPPGECTLGTPTATEMFAAGKRVEVAPRLEGRANVSATPQAQFGAAYYCTPEMNWPEACAAGRTFGPVAPDGHPQRLACERQFLGQNCPTFVMAECTGTGNECPITFDPFYVIGGINQNHPRNVEAGCHGTDWIKDDNGAVLQGMFWLASAHGKGYVQACNRGKVVCTRAKFETDW